jgi:choline dehydrogenase-like flavoprotein
MANEPKENRDERKTMKEDSYDVIVFGSGTGGKLIGWTMARER